MSFISNKTPKPFNSDRFPTQISRKSSITENNGQLNKDQFLGNKMELKLLFSLKFGNF